VAKFRGDRPWRFHVAKNCCKTQHTKYGAEPNVRPPGAISPDWGVNSGGWDIVGHIKLPEIAPNFELVWVNIHTCNFFVCGPKFTNFLLNPTGIDVDQVCSRFLISWYSRSESKVVRNRVEFSTFSLSQISGVHALPLPKKMYINDHAHLKARHVAKYCRATATTPKVIDAHLLKFKSILDPLLKKL